MKLTKKNTRPLLIIVILTTVAGAFTWALLVKILLLEGIDISLTTGRIGFDIQVIAFYLSINPGTVLGIAAGFFIFTRL